MLDTIERTEAITELPLDTAAKRALIEAELRKDPSRSDRKIADAVGHKIDHKTVGAARERVGIASPLGNSVADRMIADGNIGDGVAARPDLTVKAVVAEPEEDHFLPECADLVIPSQPATAVYTNRYDQIVIRQEASGYDDEDKFIYICPHHLDALIVRLRKFLP
jgi:hypothetical protein